MIGTNFDAKGGYEKILLAFGGTNFKKQLLVMLYE